MEQEDILSPNERYANPEELRGYVQYHKNMFLDLINGLSNLEIVEDDNGEATLLLKVDHKNDDPREINIEQAAGAMRWNQNGEEIRVRIKVETIDKNSPQ